LQHDATTAWCLGDRHAGCLSLFAFLRATFSEVYNFIGLPVSSQALESTFQTSTGTIHHAEARRVIKKFRTLTTCARQCFGPSAPVYDFSVSATILDINEKQATFVARKSHGMLVTNCPDVIG
jgi:hypothetical protein